MSAKPQAIDKLFDACLVKQRSRKNLSSDVKLAERSRLLG